MAGENSSTLEEIEPQSAEAAESDALDSSSADSPEAMYERELKAHLGLGSHRSTSTRETERTENDRGEKGEKAAAPESRKASKEETSDEDDLIADGDLAALEDELGSKGAGVLKKLTNAIRARDKIIKTISEKIGGISKYEKFLEELDSKRETFSDLGRVAKAERRRYVKDVHEAMDELAKLGLVTEVGKTAKQREANWNVYADKIREWVAKGHMAQDLAERNGIDKPLKEAIIDAFNASINKENSGAKAASAMVSQAIAEQSRRGSPAAPVRGGGAAPEARVSVAEANRGLVKQWIRQRT